MAAFDENTVMMFYLPQLTKIKHGEEFMVVISTGYHSYGIACIRCNERLIAPNWSEYSANTRSATLGFAKAAVTSSRH
jgi:hypothetical protein